MFSLCEYFVGPGGPPCPDLPGDPPLEEMLLYLAQGLLVFWGCLAVDQDAKHYIAMSGPIDDEEKAARFRELEQMRGRNLSFTFGPGLPHVDIVYRWWWQRVTIVWDRGRSAAFDLDTMTCEGFD